MREPSPCSVDLFQLPSLARAQRPRLRLIVPWIGLLVLLVAGEAASQCTGCNTSGAWTNPGDSGADWGFQQIHLALLRGGVVNDTTFHSYVISFGETGDEAEALDLYGWIPGDPGYAAYPGWSYLRRRGLTDPGVNIFCAGHSTLADGRLLVSGGHLGHDLGIEDARIFDPATLEWSSPNNTMHYPRWYPTNTTLASGNVLTVAGSKWYKTLTFGGSPNLDNSEVSIDDLRPARLRHPQIEWEPAMAVPNPDNWPDEREGHVSAWFTQARRLVVFGGRDRDGNSLQDTWAIDYTQQGAETYAIEDVDLIPGGPGRRHRPAGGGDFGNTLMMVHGGKDLGSGEVYGELHRLAFGSGVWTWTELAQSGQAPGPRWGHAAAWENNGHKFVVFGGRPASGTGLATDSVYTVSISGSNAVWTRTLLSGGPTAREGHTLVWAQGDVFTRGTQYDWARLILFGGEDAGGGLKNDTWYLWYRLENGNIVEWQWEQGPTAPGLPPARTRHSAFWDFSRHRMYVTGGDNGTASIQDLWELRRVTPNGAALEWAQVTGSVPPGLAGQSTVRVGTEHAFQPELFDAGTTEYRDGPQPGGPPFQVLGQEFYPGMFVLPTSGNVLYPAVNSYTYTLNLTNGQWSPIGTDSVSSFWGTAAVMYRPGKVVRAGGINYSKASGVWEGPLHNQTGVLDMTGTSRWVRGQWMSGPERKEDHTVTILPNGKVLVSGGAGARRPEIWDPDAPSSSWWSGLLAENLAERDYHSTVILLPDGRVMTAGGQNVAGDNSDRVTIFSPPYLFDAWGNLAHRPVIHDAPCTVAYGSTFEVGTCVGEMASGSTAALIRPGASTHSNDMNQRYVRLNFTIVGNRLQLQAPADGTYAPPGDYMLFLVNSSGVPSVAKWVRLGSGTPTGFDCTAPSQPIGPYADLVSDTEIWVYWGSAADDAPSTGTAKTYEVRHDVQAVNSEAAYCAAIASGEVSPGGYPGWRVHGLAPNTTYHFATKAQDEWWNWGPKSESFSGTTLPWGGGGGGFSARRVTGEVGLRSEAPSDEGWNDASVASASGTSGADGVGSARLSPQPVSVIPRAGEPLAVEMRLEAGRPVWTIHHLNAAEATSLTGGDGATIIYQVPGAGGTWDTRARLHPDAGSSRFGLRSAGKSRRFVFLRQVGLDVASTSVESPGGGVWRLAEARHSTLGDVTAVMQTTGGYDLGLASDETLTLTYEPGLADGESVADCFVLVSPTGTSSGMANRRRGGIGEQAKLPTTFALHQNHPNPFARFTTIRFDLAAESEVRLAVFDAQGRRVRSLVNGQRPAGYHTLEWDRRDDAGREVDAGVYLYRLEAGVFRSQRKMVLLP